MPEFAKHVHIDYDNYTVTIDGKEVPWLLAEQGVSVDPRENDDDFDVVELRVLADKVTTRGVDSP